MTYFVTKKEGLWNNGSQPSPEPLTRFSFGAGGVGRCNTRWTTDAHPASNDVDMIVTTTRVAIFRCWSWWAKEKSNLGAKCAFDLYKVFGAGNVLFTAYANWWPRPSDSACFVPIVQLVSWPTQQQQQTSSTSSPSTSKATHLHSSTGRPEITMDE